MFGGTGEKINLVAMDEVLNGPKGKWYKMEQRWKEELKKGKNIEVNIKPIYIENNKRPESFNISYKIDGGNKINEIYKNTPTGE